VDRCAWADLGLVAYAEALAIQKDAVRRRLSGEIPDTLFLLEHPPVITMGRLAKRRHVVSPRPGVDVVETDRGGDVTFHGPGQLVGYAIVDLVRWGRDVKRYLEALEATMIRAVAAFGIRARRVEGRTGAWVEDRKIAAIGVRVERWTTSHGFALNVSADLGGFDQIVPCGLEGAGVTSVERETGKAADPAAARKAVVEAFGAVFGREMSYGAEARR
jgi:lipoate-protein ligase B